MRFISFASNIGPAAAVPAGPAPAPLVIGHPYLDIEGTWGAPMYKLMP